MLDIDSIKKKIIHMSEITLKMWQMTFKTFMEHDLDLLSKVLDEEHKLNELEKEITSDLIKLSHTATKKDEKKRIPIYLDVIEDLELIGDYCKDILERVQMKIEERLLFSDEAVEEYSNLYHKTEGALKKLVEAFVKEDVAEFRKVLKEEKQIEKLVNEYRIRHNQRLIDGICSPLACNMFLNMLDFTGEVYKHTKNIAQDLLKIE